MKIDSIQSKSAKSQDRQFALDFVPGFYICTAIIPSWCIYIQANQMCSERTNHQVNPLFLPRAMLWAISGQS